MRERGRRKGNPLTLLVGMQTDKATTENSMQILKQLGINRTQQPHYWAYTPRKPELKKIPNVRCPSADEWIRKLWYIHTMEYYSAIEKECI